MHPYPHATFDLPHLILSSTTLRELEANTTASQASVDLAVGIESVVNASLLLLVEDDLQDLAAIFLGAEALADDLNGVHQVGQDGVVYGGQSSRARTLLGLRGAGAVAALGAGEDAAAGEDQDVAVGELLLKLAGESILVSFALLPQK